MDERHLGAVSRQQFLIQHGAQRLAIAALQVLIDGDFDGGGRIALDYIVGSRRGGKCRKRRQSREEQELQSSHSGHLRFYFASDDGGTPRVSGNRVSRDM